MTDQAPATSQPAGTYNSSSRNPTYFNNSSFDDNGVAPMPNNGNQNFGRRW